MHQKHNSCQFDFHRSLLNESISSIRRKHTQFISIWPSHIHIKIPNFSFTNTPIILYHETVVIKTFFLSKLLLRNTFKLYQKYYQTKTSLMVQIQLWSCRLHWIWWWHERLTFQNWQINTMIEKVVFFIPTISFIAYKLHQ